MSVLKKKKKKKYICICHSFKMKYVKIDYIYDVIIFIKYFSVLGFKEMNPD